MEKKEKTEKTEEKKADETKKEEGFSAKDIEENKMITFLSYLSVLALVPLLAKKESKFAQFHAKQGTVLFACGFLLYWASGIIPWFGGALISSVVGIGVFVLTIMGLINVANGEKKELPIIGDLAKKIKI